MNDELSRARATLPRFADIDPAAAAAIITDLLDANVRRIAELLDAGADPTWETLVVPLDELNDRLQHAWSPLRHLHSVADTDAVRQAFNAVLPKVAKYSADLMQNDRLWRAYQSLRAGSEFARYAAPRRRVIENALRDFKLGGIELDAEKRDRFSAIQQTLTQLGARFEEHVLDATRAWSWHTPDRDRLRGLPESVIGLAAQNAAQAGVSGWRLTLDLPCYQAAMMYAEDRELRRELYAAYVTRASEQGPNAGRYDNSPIIAEMLALRHELAGLLGFANYADYSLATKMASSSAQVLGFLRDLAARSRPYARREYEALRHHAREALDLEALEAWDLAFASERLRQHAYAISQEQLRPYFPVRRVLDGLFTVAARLFGVTAARVEGVETWHADVEFYRITDDQDRLRGLFYLDLHARPGKRGGAWMDECLVRRRTPDGLQYPVAYLTCNFTPPVAGQPSLLTHDEVITLFHEFGHGLHHMLTLIDEPQVAGINGVAWDAVELPSQFLENWCWEREALALLSAHHATGAPLPDELFERLRAAKDFQAGMRMARQLEFALFDFRLHVEYQEGLDVQAVLDEVRSEVAVVSPPPFNRFQHGFAHVFAGGYAAGYYSYKWAEVLSADAFARFADEGIFNRDTGTAFLRHVLEAGGAEDAMTLFKAFRGREPQNDALLRRSGLAA